MIEEPICVLWRLTGLEVLDQSTKTHHGNRCNSPSAAAMLQEPIKDGARASQMPRVRIQIVAIQPKIAPSDPQQRKRRYVCVTTMDSGFV